jgi:hypothetical protein
MLQNAADIGRRAAAELDDPSQSFFDFPYLQPFIDNEYDILANQLEAMGMAYQEMVAVFNVPANTVDLSAIQAVGGPLQYMKLPRRLKWKVQNTPDTTYVPGEFMDPSDLPEVGPTAVGITAWAWNGVIQCTPSTLALTVKLWYDVLSTTITDPETGVVQGTAHILAFRVAATVANIRGMTMEARLDKRALSSWNTFAVILSKLNQSKKIVPRKLHGIRRKVSPVGLM